MKGSTLGDIGNAIGIVETSTPFMIVIIGTAPPCGINLSQQVVNKHQSTSLGLVRQSKILEAIVDGKLTNNLDSTSIFSKAICDKHSNCSRRDLFMRFRVNLAAYLVQI